MSRKPEKRGLGRGLSALMADIEPEVSAENEPSSTNTAVKSDIVVPIEKVRPNPDQPRQDFGQKELEELASSISEKGVIQPIIVRTDPKDENLYQIIAGERRWRASQIALVHDIPIIIREMDDTEVLEVAIIENVQRSDLNPVEEALGFRQLMDSYGHTQEKLAKALGKSRSHIANILRLLSLPDDVLALLRAGQLSSGHARAMVTADNPSKLAAMVVAKGLSVRETERLVRASADAESKPKNAAPRREKDADTVVLENDLAANLNMKVSIDHKDGTGGGGITISYKSLDQLDELCQLLSSRPLGGSK
ncbi:ParB/RepB/Spo0J family partition protein [Amylibacter sp. SFDW26]|uniref:ParB/RepB/Spo0J family partition protein n=1 Tax=Amylibacter sp. SFDW26 TaxID=2652722 RepID=UPI001262AB6E|nr:ParB/RepB/Spo0J family partition protein [Amylibacter sp. SFDW26]KAB7614561.1 ParB/RepB/Spo0J family partition protein [Amylibacter sp. SFDW26]